MLSILRNRSFALIWLGGLVSLTGDWALITGVPLVVYQLTGSTLALGLTGMATALPLLLVGSIAGVFVDRWDRRWTMLVADVLLGVLLLPLVLVSSTEWLWLLVGVLVLESSIFQFYRPAEGALVPLLVPESELVTANALNGLSMNVARLTGPPLGALLVVLGGLSAVVLVDAASFLLGALTLLLVRVDLRPALASSSRAVSAVWREWLDGLRLVRTRPVPRVIFVFLAITGVGEGIMRTLFVAFATRVLQGGELTYAALLSAQAVGGLVGSLVLGQLGRRVTPAVLFGVGACLVGGIDFLIFYSPLVTSQMLVPVGLMVIVGLPVAALLTGYLTLAQTSVDDAYRGRLLGLFFATTALSGLVGMALASVLGDAIGIIPMLTLQCMGYVLGGGVVLVALARARTPVRSVAQDGADYLGRRDPNPTDRSADARLDGVVVQLGRWGRTISSGR